jgi:uncharacterized protein (DUF924 family)
MMFILVAPVVGGRGGRRGPITEKGALSCSARTVKGVARRNRSPITTITTTMPVPLPTPADVLDFWFGDARLQRDWPETDRSALWFGGGPDLDAQITTRFGPLVNSAIDGGLTEWETPLGSRLALVLLLDQFTRNVHRGTARAFAGDARAQQLVLHTLAGAQDAQLPRIGRLFLCMPLMHAENLALQHECLARLTELHRGSPAEVQRALDGNLRSARQHLDIVERFGRFPHRNAALGRASTPEEEVFLKDGPRFGQ